MRAAQFCFGGTLVLLVGLAMALGAGSEPAAEERRAACSRQIPSGGDERAAEQLLELFLRTTILAVEPGCGAELTTGTVAVPHFRTSHPDRTDGWFQLAPLVRNAAGRLEYAAFLYLQAPDAEPAAFELLLELRGRWLVSHVGRAPGSPKPDVGNLPT